LGCIFLYLIPDNQLNARWLSKDDRVLAVARVRDNQQGIGNKHFKMYQFKETLLDPMTWAFFLYALLGDIPNGGLTNFFSQLVCDLFAHVNVALKIVMLKKNSFRS
jgi:ACS family allantoate permease-like MFS transporter